MQNIQNEFIWREVQELSIEKKMFYATHQCSLNPIRYLNSLCLIHKINFKAIEGEIL